MKEGFTDYSSYKGVPLMVRGSQPPVNRHADKSRLDIANMDANSMVLRKSDPAYR